MPYLDTRQGHQLYYRLSGPQGPLPPVVLVHGGPGAACQPQDEQLFSQCQRQVVWLDQRGCGKSRSEQPLENNTSDHLIEDMERLRLELGIEKWVLVGGSWGSALSLAYGMIMICHGGVRLGRKAYLVDMATESNRASYVAVSNTVVGVIMLIGGLIGLLGDLWSPLAVILLLSGLSVMAALMCARLPAVQ